jgi:hypothetical protein
MSDVTKTGYTSLADATGGGTMAAVVEALPAVVTERVEVIAPANLPGNYELHCDFQGCPVVVRVVRAYGWLRVCVWTDELES